MSEFFDSDIFILPLRAPCYALYLASMKNLAKNLLCILLFTDLYCLLNYWNN